MATATLGSVFTGGAFDVSVNGLDTGPTLPAGSVAVAVRMKVP